MSDVTVRLLQTAAEILGGEGALARHLNIGTLLMRAYLEGRRPLPDFLLLRTVESTWCSTTSSSRRRFRKPRKPHKTPCAT